MRKILFFTVLSLVSLTAMAQGAHDFSITEVYIAQPGDNNGYLDEYG